MYMKDVVLLTDFECDLDSEFDAYFECDSVCIMSHVGTNVWLT